MLWQILGFAFYYCDTSSIKCVDHNSADQRKGKRSDSAEAGADQESTEMKPIIFVTNHTFRAGQDDGFGLYCHEDQPIGNLEIEGIEYHEGDEGRKKDLPEGHILCVKIKQVI